MTASSARPETKAVQEFLYGSPPPLPDEWHTSWIARIAAFHDCSPMEVAQFFGIQSTSKSFLQELPAEFDISRIARTTLMDPDRLRHFSTIAHWEKNMHLWGATLITDTTGDEGWRFCPECLGEGPPYLRWQWRLRAALICPIHEGTTLLPHCPQCHARLAPSFKPTSAMHRAYLANFCQCFECGLDFRSAAPLSMPMDQWLLIRAHQQNHGRPFPHPSSICEVLPYTH